MGGRNHVDFAQYYACKFQFQVVNRKFCSLLRKLDLQRVNLSVNICF